MTFLCSFLWPSIVCRIDFNLPALLYRSNFDGYELPENIQERRVCMRARSKFLRNLQVLDTYGNISVLSCCLIVLVNYRRESWSDGNQRQLNMIKLRALSWRSLIKCWRMIGIQGEKMREMLETHHGILRRRKISKMGTPESTTFIILTFTMASSFAM